MAFTAIQPTGRLAAHVAMIWDCAMETRPFGLERILPKAGASLIINLAEDETRSYRHEGAWHCQRRSGSVLVGPGTRHFIIDIRMNRIVREGVYRMTRQLSPRSFKDAELGGPL